MGKHSISFRITVQGRGKVGSGARETDCVQHSGQLGMMRHSERLHAALHLAGHDEAPRSLGAGGTSESCVSVVCDQVVPTSILHSLFLQVSYRFLGVFEE